MRRTCFLLIPFILTGVIPLTPVGLLGKSQHPERAHAARVVQDTAAQGTDAVERAVTVVCKERARDPQGSIPIDVMAAAPPLPPTDSRVAAGRVRAERLLPV